MKDKETQFTKKFYEKDRNRFMAFRYDSPTAPYPNITASALAEEFGVSKGTISFMERVGLTQDEVLSKSARLLKQYHDKFACSYEHLFFEAELPSEKHKYITDESVLANFDSSTIDNLELLLTDNNFGNFNTYMFEAFLSNPIALQQAMDVLFHFMYHLNNIYRNTSLRQGEKELQASALWFSLNQYIDSYFRDILMSNLETGFLRFEVKEEKRNKEEGERVQKLYEKFLKQQEELDSKITITAKESIPITTENKEKEE